MLSITLALEITIASIVKKYLSFILYLLGYQMLLDENKRKAKNLTYKQVYDRALELFNNDKDKVNSWWMSQCDEFNGLSPYQMVKDGYGRKVIRLLDKCI